MSTPSPTRERPRMPTWWECLPLDWQSRPIDDATYPDEYLEYWSDRYVARGYFYRGVTLMQFLANPHRYENDDAHVDPLPLLGKQRRIQSRLIMAERFAQHFQPQRDGQPLDLSWVQHR